VGATGLEKNSDPAPKRQWLKEPVQEVESKRARRISKERARPETDENGGTEMGHADRDGDGEYPVAPVGTELGPRATMWPIVIQSGCAKEQQKETRSGQGTSKSQLFLRPTRSN
jgi:hypothetical protein